MVQMLIMKFSDSFYVLIFKLASVFHLFVESGEALLARPDIITNTPVGEQVQFPIQYNGTDQYDITFRLKFPVRFKILTWKSNSPQRLHFVHPLYQHSVGIYSDLVVLNDVHVNDTGEYEIQIDYYGIELKNRDESTFRMQVFEPVSQPVTAILGDCVNSSNITLRCSVSKGTNYLIHWEKVSMSGVLSETYDVTVLVIDCVTEVQQQSYRCTAANPVSNATSDPVTVDLSNRANPNGERNNLMLLIPVATTILVLTVVYLYMVHCKSDKLIESSSSNIALV
ncbi:SLAM family member 5-like [Mustelus asterias]